MRLVELYDYNDEEGSTYFPTLKAAREEMAERDLPKGYKLDWVTVVELPRKELACLLLHGAGFVTHREGIEGEGPF